MKQHYIYLTENLINHKKYIGKHYGELNDEYLGSGNIIQRAVAKYGMNNFKKTILYISQSAEENNEKEKEFITKYNASKSDEFYNIAPGGDGGDIFHSLPIEQQEKLRKARSIQCSGSGNPMYGKHHTEATKEKIRQADKSYTQTAEYRAKMSEATRGEKNGMYGRKHTEESKRKMSEAKIGKKLGKENGNAKSISAYQDAEMTILVKHFDTIQDALAFVGTRLTDYSGISKQIKKNRPYKGYYWKKEV